MNSESTRVLVSNVDTKNLTLTSSTVELATWRVCQPCPEVQCWAIDGPWAGRSWTIEFTGVRVIINVGRRGWVNISVFQLSPAYDLWIIAIHDQSLKYVELLADRGKTGTIYDFPYRRVPNPLIVIMYPPQCWGLMMVDGTVSSPIPKSNFWTHSGHTYRMRVWCIQISHTLPTQMEHCR